MKKFDSSFDKKQAQSLAAQLAGRRTHADIPLCPDPGASSDSPQPLPAATARSLPEPPSAGFKDPNVYRDQVWQLLLEWALKMTGGERAYVSDNSGLVVAEVGSGGMGEVVPSILVTVLENLRRCNDAGTAPRQLTALLEETWICALTFSTSNDPEGGLVVGLVSSSAPEAAALIHLHKVFTAKLAEA